MSGNLKILITAGPTREIIDPVRFISNHSTGKMGYALAESAAAQGFETFLVSGPTSLSPPSKVDYFQVTTAVEMKQKVMELFPVMDIVIMAAAVCDYRPEAISKQKIKKEGREEITLKLIRNPDILRELGKQKTGQFMVGFAAETEELAKNALGKLKTKNLDMVVANNILEKGSGFAGDTNRVTLFYKDGKIEPLNLLTKQEVARIILSKIVEYRNI